MTGRGRGRGRSPGNPWKMSGPGKVGHQDKPKSKPGQEKHNLMENAQNKFEKAQAQMRANIQKHIHNEYESSSEEEDLQSDNILQSVLSSYSQKGGNKNDLGRTEKFLEDAFQSGAAICLICIQTVKRNDSIWSCIGCFCFFHLNCIQRWAKDSVMHQKQAQEEQNFFNKKHLDFKWPCPKCRHEYTHDETPKKYFCFCGKTEDPPFHPWTMPHSCGELCGKPLQPLCGHECLLLCHPGPCPSCPKTVPTKCFCGKRPAEPRRCCNKEWSCHQPCKRQLPCGKHLCLEACHAGQCPPCPRTSQQQCRCDLHKQQRPCADPDWQCDKVCGKQLSCGHHLCEQVCHKSPCPPCPLSEERHCPCGKMAFRLPCTENSPTCGDTCARLLECGRHTCSRPCHRDKCGQCLEVVTKHCRCGLHQKELPCAKEYQCEMKCKKLKDCRIHPCNRKCCDGDCPPCEKPCNRTLACKNHKCPSICHRGPCYPCTQTETISCRCTKTEIIVPCGRKRAARFNPPRCSLPCKIPPNCHHREREHHRCHFGDCPPCGQTCNRPRSSCSHLCVAKCHTAVLVPITQPNFKPAGPWENIAPVKELRELPCPDCVVPMPVTCLGGHETLDWPCYRAKPSSCGRPCGRPLPCGNHTCSLSCHLIKDPSHQEQEERPECESCERDCERPRPEGCSHPCSILSCHSSPCPPCGRSLRVSCHCGLSQVFVRCSQWTETDNRDHLLSCGIQCSKNFACGHRCRSLCHPGKCPNPELCRKKVKMYCPCKRIKREVSCDLIQQKHPDSQIACDDMCKQKKLEEIQAKEEEEMKRKMEEEKKNKEEIEKFEKKFQPRKKRDRRVQKEEENVSRFTLKFFVQIGIICALLSILLYWVFSLISKGN